jgi:photosystem II stability/assembly factor-like uncharacterized protein
MEVSMPNPTPRIVGTSWMFALLLPVTMAAAAGKTPALETTLRTDLFKDLALRALGPTNMGGRISDFAADEKRPSTFYAATGTGGLFKTTNGGTTWQAVFEHEKVASIGAVAVWQKNTSVVWVGTGESNGRNSSSWGNGVYRSTDAGGTWTHVGLDATRNIARVVVDPADSNVVYVAAMGRLWGENPERGVYKTSDFGKTWSQVLKVDNRTGAVDLVMDPQNPKVLYAALYSRIRKPWSYTGGGTTGGIFKTTDGGGHWTKLTNGLPAVTGRIGLTIGRKKPAIVMAVIESDAGGRLATFQDDSRVGGVFRSEDSGATWKRVSPWTPRGFYFSQIRMQPDDDSRVYLLGFEVWTSDDGGVTFKPKGSKNVHPDHHAMWIDPNDGDHILDGNDGGIYQSRDRGKTWEFVNNLSIGEFYTVTADTLRPYRIGGGLQDNNSWIGPSRGRFKLWSFTDDLGNVGITTADWENLGGGDGFYLQFDPVDPDIVYYESQGADLRRLDLASGRDRGIRPSENEGEKAFRFNWNSPFQVSPHDPKVVWLGGNHLFRLYERGDKWEIASPDLTTMDPERMITSGSAAETYCTIVTLQESEIAKGTIWVGTDDGKLWITRNAGKDWTDLTKNLPAEARGLYMSRIEASHHDANTACLAVDGHRTDDTRTLAYRTRDGGRTWTSITGDLPKDTPVKVVREGRWNPKLLLAGTEFGLYVTLDGGLHWFKPTDDLPTVAVDDVFIHPRERDLLIATHGRGLYSIDDIGALEHWSAAVTDSPATLFPPRDAVAFVYRGQGGFSGQRDYLAKNPGFGAAIDYWVKEWTTQTPSFTVVDSAGKTVRTLTGVGTPGYHRVLWDLQGPPEEKINRADFDGPIFVKPGPYTVKMTYGKAKEQKATFRVALAPRVEAPSP